MSELRGLVIGNSSWVSKLIGLRGNIRESNSLNFGAAPTTNLRKTDKLASLEDALASNRPT